MILFPVEDKWQLSQLYKSNHDGWDIIGTPGRYPDLVAPEDGEVLVSQYSSHKSGWPKDNWMIIKGKTYYYYMGHMKSRSVKTGDKITAGQKVGVMGNTGKSSGPHLHLEIRKTRSGRGIDPYPIFKSQMRWGKGDPSTSARTYLTYFTEEQRTDVDLVKALREDKTKLTSTITSLRKTVDTLREQRTGLQQAHKNALAEISAQKKKLRDTNEALENAESKPPEVVIKEVEKIIEKEVEVIEEVITEVEVIREVEVIKEVKPSLWDWVRSIFNGS